MTDLKFIYKIKISKNKNKECKTQMKKLKSLNNLETKIDETLGTVYTHVILINAIFALNFNTKKDEFFYYLI